MKYLITERQSLLLEEKVLRVPPLDFFGGWHQLQKFLKSRGNPTYIISGDLVLRETPIQSLGNLQSVGGDLVLKGTPIALKYTKDEIRAMVKVTNKIYF